MRKILIYLSGLLLVSSVVWTASINMPDFGIIPKATGSRPTGSEGDLFTDSTTHRLQYKDNSAWYNLVGPATTDTLTNKTLSGNIAASLQAGTGSITFNTNGAITVPNGTDTLAGISLSQALTNKTIDADANTITNIENADIKAAAAIARTKIADGTANHVVINTGSGTLSSEAALAISRGGTNNGSLGVTAGGFLYTDGTKLVNTGAGTAGQFLVSNGSSGPLLQFGSVPAVQTSDYSVLNTDTLVIVNSNGGAIHLTLPTAVGNAGKEFTFSAVSVGSNAGTDLRTTGGQTIGGYASTAIILNTAGDSITVVSDGTNYKIKSMNITMATYCTGTLQGAIDGATNNYFTSCTKRTHGEYNMSNGTWTAPLPGTYSFHIQGLIGVTTGSFASLSVIKDGGTTLCYNQLITSSNVTNSFNPSCNLTGIAMGASGTIVIRFGGNGTPTASSTTGGSWFSAIRTGP